jgi:hypothetical protein
VDIDAPEIDSLDPKWVDYVIEQLADHELVNGSPTTDGLRRVTECVFGEILYSDTEILNIRDNCITAKHTLTIEKKNGRQIQVSACVDVLKDKLPVGSPYRDHLTATACTRAEGKALRRALKIRIHTAEELANATKQDKSTNDSINDQQISALNVMCKRLNIDFVKLAKSITIDSRKIRKITSLNKLEAGIMMDTLSGYQKDKDNIPEELVGYNENWQEKFGR